MEIQPPTFNMAQAQFPQAPTQPPRQLPIRPPPQPMTYRNNGLGNFRLSQSTNNPYALPPSPPFFPAPGPAQLLFQQGFIQATAHHHIPIQGLPLNCICSHGHGLPNLHPGEIPLFHNELNDTNRPPPFFAQVSQEFENLVNSQAAIMEEQQQRLELAAGQNVELKNLLRSKMEEVNELNQEIERRGLVNGGLKKAIQRERASSLLLKQRINVLEDRLQERTKFLDQMNLQLKTELENGEIENGDVNHNFGVSQNNEVLDELTIERPGPHRVVIKRRRKEYKESAEGFFTKCAICGSSFGAQEEFYGHLANLHSGNEVERDVVAENLVKVEMGLSSSEDEQDEHSGPWIFCERCSESFPSVNKFEKHLTKCFDEWYRITYLVNPGDDDDDEDDDDDDDEDDDDESEEAGAHVMEDADADTLSCGEEQ